MLAASIIVPTYERADTLRHSLPRLLAQDVGQRAFEVIVTDDGSTDDTRDVVESAGTIYVRGPHAGAATARNRAIVRARGKVLVFVDDDAFVAPDFLARHLAIHDRDGRALVAGGIIEIREIPDAFPAVRPWRGYHRHPLCGGNSSVRREHVIAAGGFDESFDTYGWQDQELAERLLRRGLRRRFVWGAPILHYKPAAVVRDARHELLRELDRGRMGARFYDKHPRMLVGITTKMWPPIVALERAIATPLGIADQARRILDGQETLRPFEGVRAALLRAHVEISAGLRERAGAPARSTRSPDTPPADRSATA
jgi:glycosyltransferase involved in cell wall biosynthesis